MDAAGPSEVKSKPKYSLYLLLGFVISTIIALFIILILETFKRLRNVDTEKFDEMTGLLKGDFRRFGLFRK